MRLIYLVTILISVQAYGSDLKESQALLDVSNLELGLMNAKVESIDAKIKHTENTIVYDYEVRRHNKNMISKTAFRNAQNHYKVSEYEFEIEKKQAALAANNIKMSYGDIVKKKNIHIKEGSRSALHLESIKLLLQKTILMLKKSELNKLIISERVDGLRELSIKGYAPKEEYEEKNKILLLQNQKVKSLSLQVNFLKKTLKKSKAIHQKILKSGK